MSTDKKHDKVEKSPPTTGSAKKHDDHAADHSTAAPPTAVQSHEEELEGIKMLALDSAELATRSANLATHAGEHMRGVIVKLETAQTKQRKHTLIIFAVAGSLMMIAAMVFAGMAISLKSRISQLDGMVSAVGKRIGELDAAMEMVGSVNEALQEMVGKQEGIATAQGKLEARIGESIKSAQGVPEETAKQLDAKNQILAKQVQSLDGRLQAQANAIKAMSTIMQKVQGNLTDTNGLKREMEALARIQKDRQTAESQASAQASAATLQAVQQAAQQAAAAARQKEKMVQYPRAQAADAQAAGSGGVVSVKP
jgi:hypothetical protein